MDGDDNTYWCSGESDKQWFMVDLGRNYDIGRVVIDWNSDAGKMYDIQVSTNGTDWTTVYRQQKDTEMQLLMYQCLPMQDTLECTDIQELKVVADLA